MTSNQKDPGIRAEHLIEQLPIGVVLFDSNCRLIFANSMFTHLTGYQPREIDTLDSFDTKAFPDTDYRSRVFGCSKEEHPHSQAARVVKQILDITCKNGEKKSLEFQKSILPNGQTMLTLQDISDRVQARKQVQKTRKTLASIFNAAPTGIGMVQNRIITRVNKALCYMIGYTEAELIGQSARILYPTQEDFEFVGTEKYRQIKAHGTGTVQTVWQKKNGRIINVLLSSTPINPDDWSEGVTFTALDVTDQIQSQKIIQESEKKYRALVETTDTGFVFVDAKGCVLDANQTYVKMTGARDLDQILGKNVLDWTATYDIDRNLREVQKCVETGAVQNLEIDYIDEDGNTTPIEIFAKTIKSGDDVTILTLCRDISERKMMEKALRKSEARYRRFFEEIMSGAFISTPDGKLLDCNQEFIRMFGFNSREEAKSYPISHLYKDASKRADFLARLKKQKGVKHYESHMKRKDGSPVYILENAVGVFDTDGELVTIRGYLNDITETRNMENQLRQAQKMEAIGTLVGGISHDFNNLLQAINGYAELLCMKKTPDDPDFSNLTAMRKVSRRAGDLVRQLLIFSREAKSKKKWLLINAEIRQACSLLEKTIPKMISIKRQLAEDLWPVNADPLQIEQVILNLGSNASDAMPDGGVITIKTRNCRISENPVKLSEDKKPGEYICLTISDTGVGMAPETVEKIFDPFFTTKKTGKGTGLGLSSVYGIIKNHGGYIECTSRIGKGTVFTILLPAQKKKMIEEENDRPNEIKRGNETILLVDDEEAIRNFARSAFMRLGYQYLGAASGEEAIEQFKKNKAAIDLVLLDLSMPGMGGYKCLKALLAMDPHLKILISSGYSANTTINDCMSAGAADYIRKPYQLHQLFTKIRAILDHQKEKSPDTP